MIPRFKPAIGIQEYLAALHPPSKLDVEHFEQSFAKLMGQNYGIAFPFGRTALMLLLEALKLKNKEIICPAYTCVVVPHAITYSGNIPVFIDCERAGFNMDLDIAEKAITRKTGAIIATSLFGYPVNLDHLDAIQKRHPHIYIIQDCAHSFSAEWNGRAVQKRGIAAFFSLNISKTLTSIFGGIITTDNKNLFHILKQMRTRRLQNPPITKSLNRFLYFLVVSPAFWEPLYGLVNKLERSGLLNHFVNYYDEKKIDMPKDHLLKMSPIEARVGRININRYNNIIETRKSSAQYYFGHLADSPDFKLPPNVVGATYSHFVVRVKNRISWLGDAIHKNIQLGKLIEYSIPEMKVYGEHNPEKYPFAAKYARTAINLPVWGGKVLARKVITKLTRG